MSGVYPEHCMMHYRLTLEICVLEELSLANNIYFSPRRLRIGIWQWILKVKVKGASQSNGQMTHDDTTERELATLGKGQTKESKIAS